MISYPSFEEVASDLGDKVINGICSAVSGVATDLGEYRRFRPQWVAAHTERGLAGWIHDRIWDRLVSELDGIASVTLVDREPLREFFVGTRYRLRVKRHHLDGSVSSYPTEAALDFFGQVQLAFPGLDEVRLLTGYDWISDLREVGEPVMSLRDGQDEIIWLVRLPAAGSVGPAGPQPLTGPSVPTPAAPVIGVPGDTESEARDREGT